MYYNPGKRRELLYCKCGKHGWFSHSLSVLERPNKIQSETSEVDMIAKMCVVVTLFAKLASVQSEPQ